MFVKGSVGEIELINHPLITDHINIALFIRGEGSDALGGEADLAHGFQGAIFLGEAPDAFGSVIPTDINAVKGGVLVAAINVTTRDRVSVLPFVRKNWRHINRSFFPVTV